MRDVRRSNCLLSIVIPAYNEAEVIQVTVKRIHEVMLETNYSFELIVVDDGSTDDTLAHCINAQNEFKIRIIHLPINQGHMAALRAGLQASVGNYIATLDADLQDPPEEIPAMLKILLDSEENSNLSNITNQIQVVQAYRANRETDKFFKKASASAFYFLIRKITGIKLTPHAADYRIMNRKVVDKLLDTKVETVYRLTIPSMGYRIYPYPVRREIRAAGQTKYTFVRMMALALDSAISFSHKPLRLVTYTGLITSGIFFLGAIVIFLVSIIGDTVPGWPSLALLVMSLNSFMFASVGVIGEYVGRIYNLIQNRPRIEWIEISN
jgi:dolichol-phosphate mannosyltransferase